MKPDTDTQRGWSKRTIGLTRFADPYLLQVGLLDVVKVLDAGDIEAISDTQVELLQLDVSQELVQPLSVLVHNHDPGDLPLGSKVERLTTFSSLEIWDITKTHNYQTVSVCQSLLSHYKPVER